MSEAQKAKKTGRPSNYSDKVVDEICERIADGESLTQICEEEDKPSRRSVFRWLNDPANELFRRKYARAREASAEATADDVEHISRMAARGEIEPAAARAAIDGLKWSAGKRSPKKYGDKVALTGPDDGPIKVDLSGLSEDQLAQLETLLSTAGAAAAMGSAAE